MDLVRLLADDPSVRALCARALDARRVVAQGSTGSSTAFVAAAVARRTGRPVVLTVAHLDEADETAEELQAAGVVTVRLPALEVLPGESGVSLDLFAQRLAAIRVVLALDATGPAPVVIVCPVQALMQGVPDPATLPALATSLARGDPRGPSAIIRWLEGAGYRRVDAVEEPGHFAVRGGILDVFPPGDPASGTGEVSAGGVPVRLDFFGDELERITEIDLETMASDRAVSRVDLVCAALDGLLPGGAGGEPPGVTAHLGAGGLGGGRGRGRPPGGGARRAAPPQFSFLDLVPPRAVAVLHETMEVTEQARGYYERVTDAAGIFGPPAVVKLLQDRFAAFVEVNGFSTSRLATDELIVLPVSALPPFARDAGAAVAELAELTGPAGTPPAARVVVYCQNDGESQRLAELLREFGGERGGRVEPAGAFVSRGFVWSSEGQGGAAPGAALPTIVVPYHELLHRFDTRRRAGGGGSGAGGARRLKAGRAMDTFLDFQVGDYVVHREHGISRFVGLTLMRPGAAGLSASARVHGDGDPLKRVQASVRPLRGKRPKGKGTGGGDGRGNGEGDGEREVSDLEEFLVLEFAAGAKVYVPCTKIDQVQKYIGGFRGSPPLSAIGGQRWKNQKEQAAESVRDLAGELLRVRAAREHLPGVRFPGDTAWQKEFEAEFPYEETQDQLAALGEIKRDMQSDRPMDRLLCGDVGYGKTELAIRAAFKAVEFGKQVAVLVPTTVLAEQHERTFRARFADYPFRVESLSRFKTTKEINDTLAALRKGQIDVVIGTHRLISKDVKFADLGVVVVDEEQRFGVEHKERLLSLRMTVDVLTLSATPIPRTLHLSMLGLRDISSLATPPMDRRAVVTEVIPYNERRIEQAIARELTRDGQCFFVHNRIHNIHSVADDVRRLSPEGTRIVVGHGQMEPRELEAVMLTFMRRQADILVSTTIIESGIDIPTANTMFINDADRFGLADLHQLRGRVGRYKHRAYCYLLLPNDRTVTGVAKKRLRALEEFSMLGAGFKIAMRDLEIRGAGNILGPEQSGHIAAVGYEMYCELLDRAVKDLKNEPTATPSETAIDLGVSGLIPKAYIPSDARRLDAYRRLALAAAPADLERLGAELAQAYGAPPAAVKRLIDLTELRIAASRLGARSVAVRGADVVVQTEDPAPVAAALRGARGAVTVLPPPSNAKLCEVYYRPPEGYLTPETLLAVLRKHFAVGAGADGESAGAARGAWVA